MNRSINIISQNFKLLLNMHLRFLKLVSEFSVSIRYFLVFIIAVLFSSGLMAQGTNLIYISGKVTDKDNGTPLSGVSVSIKGTIAGTVSSDSGSFTIRTKTKFPFTLVFSSVGFQPQEFEVKGIGFKCTGCIGNTDCPVGKKWLLLHQKCLKAF